MNSAIVAIENMFLGLKKELEGINDPGHRESVDYHYWQRLCQDGALSAVRGKTWVEGSDTYFVRDDLTLVITHGAYKGPVIRTHMQWGEYQNGMELSFSTQHVSTDPDPQIKSELNKIFRGQEIEHPVNSDGMPYFLAYHFVKRSNGELFPLPLVFAQQDDQEVFRTGVSAQEIALMRAQLRNWAIQ